MKFCSALHKYYADLLKCELEKDHLGDHLSYDNRSWYRHNGVTWPQKEKLNENPRRETTT